MANSLFKLLFITIMLTIISSCSSIPDELEDLDKTVRAYERAIRWGEFISAKSFHKNDPVLHSVERRRLKYYRISGYSVLRNETPDLFNAYILVEIKYYKNDRPVIKILSEKQHWKREKDSKVWFIDSPFPNFR